MPAPALPYYQWTQHWDFSISLLFSKCSDLSVNEPLWYGIWIKKSERVASDTQPLNPFPPPNTSTLLTLHIAIRRDTCYCLPASCRRGFQVPPCSYTMVGICSSYLQIFCRRICCRAAGKLLLTLSRPVCNLKVTQKSWINTRMFRSSWQPKSHCWPLAPNKALGILNVQCKNTWEVGTCFESWGERAGFALTGPLVELRSETMPLEKI